MTTPRPHKHADLIIAWANGAEIQIRSTNVAEPVWVDLGSNYSPSWSENQQYRIKPEKKWYRVAEFENGTGKVYPSVTHNTSVEVAWATHPAFKRWITDRIYYE